MADRKRLNTQIDSSMADVLERWQEEWGKTESEIVRVALTIGLQSLRNDPTPLGPRPPSTDAMSPPKGTDKAPPTRPRVDLPDPPRKKRKAKPDPFDTGDGSDS